MYKESDEEIRNRMLNKVPNDLNKSQGSFFYDVFSPISQELAQVKTKLDEILNRVFIKSAIKNGYSEEIEMRALESGISRKTGTYALGKETFMGIDDTYIPAGTIVQTELGLQFKTLKDGTITNGEAIIPIQALEVGSIYVVAANTIKELPVQILGVAKVTNEASTEGGTDIEDDNSLADRYFSKIQKPVTSGNDNHYKQWALEVPGVGGAKVFPLWSGNGTVKIVIVDENKKAPTENLIKKAYEYIEKNRPIGAKVTVIGAKEKAIDISASITLANNYNIAQVQEEFICKINNLFKEIAFNDTYVSYAKSSNLLLNVPGVLDYMNFKINGDIKNIGLEDEEIPVLRHITLEV
ncbi:baseplate J/gp47 family protein [Clostridium lundense]|uniref:baseplate J/gp47 family protein n=1 Tax=Clostridium lundense TaxID=319475 RepID=UPI000481D0FF|nr:baseplate J/gp47 family protein [Clostridium lundense]